MLRFNETQVTLLARDLQREQVLGELMRQGVHPEPLPRPGCYSLRDVAGRAATLSFEEDGSILVTSACGRRVSRWFDYQGELIRLIDAGGLIVTVQSDLAANSKAIVREGFGTYRLWHDPDGWLDRIDYPDGTSVRYEVPAAGCIQVIGRGSEVSTYSLDADGELAEIVDANGNRTRVAWTSQDDGDGRCCTVVQPDGSRYEFHLDTLGLLREWLVNGASVARYRGQAGPWPAETVFHDGSWIRLRTQAARVVRAESAEGYVALDYDDAGRIVAEDQNGRIVRYERDATGLLTAIVLPDGVKLQFERDGDSRIATVRDWSGRTTHVGWAPNGQLAEIVHPNGVVTAVESNPIGLPTRIDTLALDRSELCTLRYRHDAGDRVSFQSSNGVGCHYIYDAAGRLVEARGESGNRERWSVDAIGNRLSDASGATFTADSRNRISGNADNGIRYDIRGRTVSVRTARGPARFCYDGRGQLVQVQMADGRSAEYAYDAFGRRIRKTVNGRVTQYLWAGQTLLSEQTEGRGFFERRDHLFLPEAFLPLAVRTNGQVLRVHADHRCAPVLATDDAGRPVWRAEYDAFGTARVSRTGQEAIPWRLANQYEDDETGLHYNLARYYHAGLGRYLTPDPAFDPANRGNPYLYAAGDPVNQIDPTGEIIPLLVAGFVVGGLVAGAIKAYQVRNEPTSFGDKAGQVAKSAVIGGAVGVVGAATGAAVVGGLAAVGVGVKAGIAAAVGVGAVEGAVSSVVEACVEGKIEAREPTAREILLSVAVGAGAGAVTAGVGGTLAARSARKALRAARKAKLDARFGAPRPPRLIKPHERIGEVVKRPKELQEVTPGIPPRLDPSKALPDGKPGYIWLIDENGKMYVAPEEVVLDASGNPVKDGDKLLKLGHPTLVGGANARIGGELHYVDGRWVMNNQSGRYSVHPDRSAEQLENAASVMRESGLDVETDFRKLR